MKKEKKAAPSSPFDNDMFIDQARMNVANRQNFEELEATNEYVETHYFAITDPAHNASLVPLNKFWCDWARHLASRDQGPFLSAAFTDCHRSDRESLLALAVLDLPIATPEQHTFEPDAGRGVKITASCALVMFKKEIRDCPLDLSKNDIMVIHRYHETQAASAKEGKPAEFLAKTAYECEVVITNVAPKSKAFNLLYQVPEGAVPLRETKYMKSQFMQLQPYRSEKRTFHFYFPTSGQFAHFPSNVAATGVVTARGGHNELRVVDHKKITQVSNFDDLLLAGSQNDVLDFLRKENLYSDKKKFGFHKMCYLLKDKSFFKKVIEILSERLIFEPEVLQFAFFHKDDLSLMRQYLQIAAPHSVLSHIGTYFTSQLFDMSDEDPNCQGFNKHLEYHPMVNGRAHALGSGNQIQNKTFRQTYEQFLCAKI